MAILRQALYELRTLQRTQHAPEHAAPAWDVQSLRQLEASLPAQRPLQAPGAQLQAVRQPG